MTLDSRLSNYFFDEILNLWVPEISDNYGYSDGEEIENRIYEIIKNSKDRSVFSGELKLHMTDWASTYHLSPRRSNLLRPLIDSIEGPILEIGAGMGPITRYLGESGKEVYAIEGSLRRAAIAAERCRDLPNVKVIADVFQNYEGPKFQTITLIGVLEYSRLYFPAIMGKDPIDAILEKIYGMLEPDGQLIIAIENKLGLKYFAGYNEDHLSQPMVGIENRYQPDGIVTFGKNELSKRLASAGYSQLNWWYPFPDYKLVNCVFSSEGIQSTDVVGLESLLQASSLQDMQKPSFTSFSLQRTWASIFQNGLAGDLSNSFLVQASSAKVPVDNRLFSHYAVDRKKQFAKETRLVLNSRSLDIEVTPLYPEAKNEQNSLLSHKLQNSSWHVGKNWHLEFVRILATGPMNQELIREWLQVWKNSIEAAAKITLNSPTRTLIPGELIDAIPGNLIFTAEGPKFFDLEWKFKSEISLGYLLFRGLFNSINNLENLLFVDTSQVVTLGKLLEQILVENTDFDSSLIESYFEEELKFQNAVSGVSAEKAPQWNQFYDQPIPQQMNLLTLSRLSNRNLSYTEAEIETGMGIPGVKELIHLSNVTTNAELADVVSQLHDLKSSTSWKMTKWTRTLSSLLRRN